MSADTASQFYDGLAEWYHLVYSDWNASIGRQGAALDRAISRFLGAGTKRILDVACGIGTQSLGLSALGHTVVASDISANAIKRAEREASARGLQLEFSVADMRTVRSHHGKQFDVVLCADNSLPHLLSDAEILLALEQFYACTSPGGICLISTRDYGKEEQIGTQLKPYGVRVDDGHRYIIFQTWDWHDQLYDVSLYLVRDQGDNTCPTTVFRSTYYAIPVERTCELLTTAGFVDVTRLPEASYFQPLIVGRKPAQAVSHVQR